MKKILKKVYNKTKQIIKKLISRIQKKKTFDEYNEKDDSNLSSFTLVTAANHRYFKYLRQVLNNVIEIIKNEKYSNIQINIVVYNLGLKKEELEKLKTFSNIIIENFDYSKYPEHVSLEKYNGKNCNYSWKPIIIYEVCEKYGGLVNWMDTKNLYSDFTELIDILETTYIYTPRSSGNVRKWTHITTLKYMNGYKYKKKRCRAGGVFGINYDIQWCKDLVKEWKELALIKKCICPKGSDRNNHRQDQAVLTLLYYKYHEKYKFKQINHYVNLSVHNSLLNN